MKNKDQIWIKWMDFGQRIGCHQMPERSFFYKNYQFPVCARCTGVIIGEIIAILLIIFSVKINALMSFILLMIMGFDWSIQFINVLESNNIRRLITGISGGIGLTYIYYNVFVYLINLVINGVK